MDWKCGSNGRVPALGSPEFKPHSCQKKKKRKKLDLSFNIFLKVKTPKAQANWTNI
jgi:hypothetical protein